MGMSPDSAQAQQDGKAKDPLEILLVQSLAASDELELSAPLLTSSSCVTCWCGFIYIFKGNNLKAEQFLLFAMCFNTSGCGLDLLRSLKKSPMST